MPETLYRVECICSNKTGENGEMCGEFLMGSNEKPHMTASELHKNWTGMVISAPLNAPRCPKCDYATDRDYNAGTAFLIDDGTKKVTSGEWFKQNPS